MRIAWNIIYLQFNNFNFKGLIKTFYYTVNIAAALIASRDLYLRYTLRQWIANSKFSKK